MLSLRLVERSDIPVLKDWYKAHGQPDNATIFLPPLGFIVPNVAAGFLCRTDSKVAFLDCYISNPESFEETRDEALDSITEHLLRAAFHSGFKKVIALTNVPAIVNRAQRFGFSNKMEFTFLVREVE